MPGIAACPQGRAEAWEWQAGKLCTLRCARRAGPAGEAEGTLCIKSSWPGAIRTVFGDQERFEMVYFAPFQVGGWAAGVRMGGGWRVVVVLPLAVGVWL